MNYAKTSDSALHDLGYKIFLDRYAQKDMTRDSLSIGDKVIVVVDSATGQREVGVALAIDLPQVSVELLDGTVVARDLEHVDKPLETDPAQMMDRVARGVADTEADPARQLEWSQKFRWLLDDWKFVPGGRILTAAGTDQDLTYYNCYVIPSPLDSREGIMTTLTQMTEIMSRGGGVGINLSTLRPRHAYVKGVNGRSSGAVSWGALYSFVTGLIEQGGSRRGALMLILNDWHPDVFNFINSKREAGKITNANISVGVSDRLMEAVANDDDWQLRFPDTRDPDYDELWDGDLNTWMASGRQVITYKTVKARDLWHAIIHSAWSSAEPGLWFNERSNKMANSWYFNPLISTNPCGEQPLGAFSVCNLGAINLSRFYDADNRDVAWEPLRETVRYATRFLDNVIDSTPYFFEENERVQKAERRVGLGTMGIAELMLRLGVRYGSDDSVALIDQIYKMIATTAYETSSELAREKGAFPHFDAEKFLESGYMQGMPAELRDKIRHDGIRNVTLLTQAPTGTTGTMVNTSTGVEPFFSWIYYRKSRLGLHEEQVPIVKEWQQAHPEAEELPPHFVTAMDLSPEEHIKVQGAFQRWIDSAISKTCNVPADYTVEQVSDLYRQMYELGCKGGTIYRDGSRDEQVLMRKGDERAQSEMDSLQAARADEAEAATTPHRVYPRPASLQGVTRMTQTPIGKAYITINSDDQGNPFEVFILIGKAGSDIQADAESLGRMISLQLRATAPANRREMLKLIIEQLQGIGGARPIGIGPKRVLSLPDAVARSLEAEFFPEEEPQQLDLPIQARTASSGAISGADMCPACGTIALVRAENCRKCLACDYSEC